MDVSHIVKDLNKAQREAVTSEMGAKLILAGAGSGKTRVLIHRIAWLIQVEQVSPWAILAVTFTNKAAKEMRGRAEMLLGSPLGGMWMGTFHGLAHRLLRLHWQEANLAQNFQILDSDDQLRLVKRLSKEANLDTKNWPPRQTQYFINNNKEEGRRPQHIETTNDLYAQQMVKLYAAYEEACQRGGLVDFAELLLRAHELWLQRPDVLQNYQQRFQHILVDEFQDTNSIQYAWLRNLAGDQGHIFAVGDDDQSIYGWRGAKIENIQDFQSHFKAATLIKLEQNYRSSGNILAGANAVIANNPSRLGKNLWTADEAGEPIKIYRAFNEIDEARFVIDKIIEWIEQGNLRASCAILYRSNAQSRLMEEALLQMSVPYRVYGGLRFFERSEVKDALAYLHLVANQYNDAAFERAINQPPRGIGTKTLERIRAEAKETNQPLWQASFQLIEQKKLTPRIANLIQFFMKLITDISATETTLGLKGCMTACIKQSGLKAHFGKNRDGKGEARIENLDELINTAGRFNQAEASFLNTENMTKLSCFLSHVALEAGETQGDSNQDCVQLMTLHSAKGLEFPLVFLIGLEEGLFPHSMSAYDPARLEEERRLCYVGMTRAMRQLYICYAESRYLRGEHSNPVPSRFLREIPKSVCHEVRNMPTYQPTNSIFKVGQTVRHPNYGEGPIVDITGTGGKAIIQINFDRMGERSLMANTQGLKIIK